MKKWFDWREYYEQGLVVYLCILAWLAYFFVAPYVWSENKLLGAAFFIPGLFVSNLLIYFQHECWHNYFKTPFNRPLFVGLGAEYAVSWSVDSSRHGIGKAFCCFNAAARDFAKFGSLYFHRGNSDGRQLLNADWVARQSSPSGIDTQRSLGYGNNWWIPLNNKEDDDLVAIGIHGQYIYVNPKKKTVIVKLSEHEVEEDVLLTLATFQLISSKLDSATYPVTHQSAGAT